MPFQKREFYENQGNLILEGKLSIDPSNDGVRNMVLAIFSQTDAGLVLNIGIGPKPIVDIALMERGYKVIGIDISHALTKIAKAMFVQKGFNPSLTVSEALNLPFADAVFDFCLCAEVIEHLQDSATLFREINRILKPGGKLILTTPSKISLAGVILGLKQGFNKNIAHVREYTGSEIIKFTREFFKLKARYYTRAFPAEECSFLEAPVGKICNFIVSLPYLNKLGNHMGFLFEKLS